MLSHRVERQTPSLFASIRTTMLSDGTWIGMSPRRRRGATQAEVEAALRQDIIDANHLNGRADAKGRLYEGQLPLTREELANGPQRKWNWEDRAAANVYQNPPQAPESPEQRHNRELRERVKQDKFNALSANEKRLIESNKRLAAEQAEAARAQVRQRKDFLDVNERLDNLEFLLKFDPNRSPMLLDAVQHIRRTLHETTDVPAAFTNLATINAIATGQKKLSDLTWRPSVDSEALAAEWSLERPAGAVWDRPPQSQIDSGVEMTRLFYGGKTAYVSAGLLAGKTDTDLVREFFPQSVNHAPA